MYVLDDRHFFNPSTKIMLKSKQGPKPFQGSFKYLTHFTIFMIIDLQNQLNNQLVYASKSVTLDFKNKLI